MLEIPILVKTWHSFYNVQVQVHIKHFLNQKAENYFNNLKIAHKKFFFNNLLD